jgi:WD40 repeat protein
MGNESSIDLKTNYICNICKKILKQPCMLPCACSNICQDHIKDTRKRERIISCSKCQKSFNLNEESFKENELIQNKIDKCLFLTSKEKKQKILLDKCLQDLNGLLLEFSQALSEFSLAQYERFANIKNDIDIKRELLIDEVYTRVDVSRVDSILKDIHAISAQMLDDVDRLEQTFWTSLNKIKSPFKNESYIQMEQCKLDDIFRNPYLSPQLLENLKLDFSKELSGLKENFKAFKSFSNDTRHNEIDLKKFSKLNSFQSLLKHKQGQYHQSRIVTCSFSQTGIYIWDLNENVMVKSIANAHADSVLCLEVIKNEKLLISGGKDKLIKIWDFVAHNCLRTLTGHTSWIWCLKLLLKSNHLASGSTDTSVKIWDWSSGVCLFTLFGHSAAILCLEYLVVENETFLLTGSSDTSIRMWSLNMPEAPKCVKTLYCNYTSSVTCLKVVVMLNSSNMSLLASGYDDNTVRIWNLSKGECIHTLTGHSSWINCLDFMFERQLLVSLSADEEIRIWDLNESK